jgi:homeobox protein ESX1
LQKSVVQATPSSQLSGTPFMHPSIALHVSTPSQATPLLQSMSLGMFEHESAASLQSSTVHETPSSHGDPELAVQPVPGAPVAGLHDSVPLQNRPSLQATLLGAFVQTPIMQTSTVQEKPSSHSPLLTHPDIVPPMPPMPPLPPIPAAPPIPPELELELEAAIPPEPPIPPIPPELVVIAPPIPLDEATMPPAPPEAIPPEPAAPPIPPAPPEAPPAPPMPPVPPDAPLPPSPPLPAVPDELELAPPSPLELALDPDSVPLPDVVVEFVESPQPLTMVNVIAAIQCACRRITFIAVSPCRKRSSPASSNISK